MIRQPFLLQRALRTKGKHAFLASLPNGSRILDVGCGNDGPLLAKRTNPTLQYVGVDIGDYNQSAAALAAADEYILVTPDHFASAISARVGEFDAVISSHNLEHCDAPFDVLTAMCRSLKPGGRLYIALPSEASEGFPSRTGTLNYWDDPTHKAMLSFEQICAHLTSHRLEIGFRASRYRPTVLYGLGALLEPVGMLTKRNMPLASSWAFHGFEAVIWAELRH